MVFATNNKGKLNELKSIFDEDNILSLEEVGINLEVKEDQMSFYGNASKKAKQLFDLVKVPAIADDSGLCIDELNGFPGVHTHRFLGENKTDLEINEAIINKCRKLKNRRARVVCCLVYYDGKEEIVSEEEIVGNIVLKPRGNNGFGFDPIFELENGQTLAEIDSNVKNLCSARYLAAKKINDKIKNKLEKTKKL